MPNDYIIARPDDLRADQLHAAFVKSSLHTGDVIQTERHHYTRTVNGLYAELLKACSTEAQRAVLESGIRQFRDGYIERFPAYLAAQGGVGKRNVVPRKRVTGMQEARAADNATFAFREWVAQAQNELRAVVARMGTPAETPRTWTDKVAAGRAREKVAAL